MPTPPSDHTSAGVLIGELIADVARADSAPSSDGTSAAPPDHWLLELSTEFDLAAWAGGSTVTAASPVHGAKGLLRPEGHAWTVQQRVPRFIDKVVLGRGRSCDIVVPDPGVSKQHAYLSRTGDGLIVQDAGSRNGTFVNGARLLSGARATLRDGDVLQLGPAVALCFVLRATLRALIGPA